MSHISKALDYLERTLENMGAPFLPGEREMIRKAREEFSVFSECAERWRWNSDFDASADCRCRLCELTRRYDGIVDDSPR